MKVKLSDYIADFIIKKGITDVFSVTGGGSMHLNNSFGKHAGLTCTYNHHEQACAIAAEAYARIDNRMAAVCVTSGPGATNAVTGVLSAYMDSIPLLIFSGQVRFTTTVRSSGLSLRFSGEQEFDICLAAKSMTKYCEMVIEPEQIKYHLEKAVYLAASGRPGPVWLDIPLDIQGAVIETDNLIGFKPEKAEAPQVKAETVDLIINSIKTAERPVLFVGNGVRLSGAHSLLLKLIDRLNIPVVCGMGSVDALWNSHPLFAGRSGSTGDRAGNFAVQNSDLFFSIGSRLGFKQTGFNYKAWARAATKIVCDIDKEELKKENIAADIPVHADAFELISALYNALPNERLFKKETWLETCRKWRQKYPVVTPKHYEYDDGVNVYCFYKELSKRMAEGESVVVSAGTARIAGSQAFEIKKDQRFISNASTAAMGYCLPAAIGVCVAKNRSPVVCVTGEGSLQMNIQELQTIVTSRLPIRVFVLNNGGYHSIRQTQNAFFGEPLVGVGEGDDLGFPDLRLLAPAYGFSFLRCNDMDELASCLDTALASTERFICEVMCGTSQNIEPRSATKKLADISLISSPLEDMFPFLNREELKENMFIPLVD